MGPSLQGEKVSAPSDCSVCPQASLENIEALRAHFKCDWHLFNLRAKVSGMVALQEEEYIIRMNSADLGSDTEPATSDEDEEFNEDQMVRDPFVRFKLSTMPHSTVFEAHRCIFMSQASLKIRPQVIPDSLTISRSLIRESDSTWFVLLMRSGRVFAAIFDNRNNQILSSKSLKRYTTRRKQGGSQLLADAAKGGRFKSAGAMLRRANETLLKKEVHEMIAIMGSLISRCSIIFWNASRTGRMYIDGSGLEVSDPRLHSIPFTTHKPNIEEAWRCYKNLFSLNMKTLDS